MVLCEGIAAENCGEFRCSTNFSSLYIKSSLTFPLDSCGTASKQKAMPSHVTNVQRGMETLAGIAS